LSWPWVPPFDSSPKGEPLIGERIRQVADFSPLEAGGWKLAALSRLMVANTRRPSAGRWFQFLRSAARWNGAARIRVVVGV
jgi:hypothetical protein